MIKIAAHVKPALTFLTGGVLFLSAMWATFHQRPNNFVPNLMDRAQISRSFDSVPVNDTTGQVSDAKEEMDDDSLDAMAHSLPEYDGYCQAHIYRDLDSGAMSTTVESRDNDSLYIAVGNLLDSTHIFAIVIRNSMHGKYDTASVSFYRREEGNWIKAGRFGLNRPVIDIFFKNNLGRGKSNDIRLFGGGNMNGNGMQWFFAYDQNLRGFKFTGDFFSSFYEIDNVHHCIKMQYMGSWYMDNDNVLFLWHNDSLVLLRQATRSMLIARMDTIIKDNYRLTYYVNSDTCYSGGLKVVFSEIDKEHSAHHKKYWDHFFDLK